MKIENFQFAISNPGVLLARLRKAALILLPAASFALASCSSKPPMATGPVHTFQDEAGGFGYGGQSLIQTTETNATVISIDAATRRIGLQYPGGGSTIYRAGPEIVNFARIKIGDQVKATITEQLALSVVAADALGAATNQATVFQDPTRLELGPKPVATMKFTAKILALDPFERNATLQLADGTSRTIKVREGVELGALDVGNDVSVLVTKAMTLTLENP